MPSPPLHPGTGQPIGPDDLAPLFPMALILQEVSTDREIEIPDPVREAYALYRPSPLYRAHRLEAALDTPAHIYYKYEGVSPAGSHKPNTAVAQAFFNKQEGVKRLATETGAGQWGSALAFAGAALRARGQGLHGPRQLRPEAVPPDAHGDLRRRGRGQPEPDDQLRAQASSPRRPTPRVRWASPSARPSRTQRPATTRSTRSARCSTTCSCTRRSSARRRSSRWRWPARSRTSSSAAPAAAPTSPA